MDDTIFLVRRECNEFAGRVTTVRDTETRSEGDELLGWHGWTVKVSGPER